MSNQKTQKWTILEEEDVSPSPWFPLLRHKVQLANGLIIDDYYFAPLGDVVMVLALTRANEVILVEQYKHGIGEVLLELPGGMQQTNKSVVRSALNELEEETGVKANADQLIPLGKIIVNGTKTRQTTYGFILFDAEFNAAQNLDTTEDIEVKTIPAKQLLQYVKDEQILAADSISFILKAALMYPEIFGQ